MNGILLLDLDGTLLSNRMQDFMPAYLGAISRFMAPWVDPDLFIRSLLACTQKMIANQRPDQTLQEAFEQDFFRLINKTPAEMQPHIEQFYAQVYPGLLHITSPKPGACDLVDGALARGYIVGIATNPLFPLTAIEQRLSWAGLDPSKYPFALVPSYSTFHFSKPDTAYYAEFLYKLGWPNTTSVMVGNNLQEDILPACALGLSTYWIPEEGENFSDQDMAASATGELNQVLNWMDHLPDEKSMHLSQRTPSAMIALLQAAPATLDSLCRNITINKWKAHPVQGEWCLNEIVCHLRDVENEVNLPRLKQIIGERNPFIPGVDSDSWIAQRHYHDQDGIQALHDFIAIRIDLINLLKQLDPQDWQRDSRHAIFGPTQLVELVGFQANHDLLHIRQVIQTLESVKIPK